jgi:urease accessory protein
MKGARALVTTPAATKFYRSLGETAHQTQELFVESGAMLEWFPQETIVFGGALVQTTTRVEVEPWGHFAGWDIVCLGRPHSGDHFASGHVRQMLEIADRSGTVFVERATYEAMAPSRQAPWGLGEKSVVGSFVWLIDNERQAREVCEQILASARTGERELFSVTAKRRVVVCRYLGASAESARRHFIEAWKLLRPTLKREVVCPRIWST